MTRGTTTIDSALQRWERRSLLVSVAAWIVCLLGCFLDSAPQFFRAYFAAYLFFVGISLGCMAILMIYHLTGGAWGYVVRPILEAQLTVLPLMALLSVPLAFGLPSLYPWARAEAISWNEKLQSQQFYFNEPFFLNRAAVYFIVWLLIAWRLSVYSRQQAMTDDPRVPWKLQRLSEVGLVTFGTTMHFAAFDWIQSVQSNFHSTIFPLLVVAGQLQSAQALVILVFVKVSLGTEAADYASSRVLNDLGNLLLAFLIIWSYMFWFQFMLSWMADQRADALWILPRSRGGWLQVTWVLIAFNFVIPLVLLLMRGVKGNPVLIQWVAALILVMQLIFSYRETMPAFDSPRIREHWLDFLTPFAIGGAWLAWFLRRLRLHTSLVPHDPNRERAMHLRLAEREEWDRERSVAHV